MIYFILSLFFLSLLGIIFMIERKLVRLQNGEVLPEGEPLFHGPHMEDLKRDISKSLKKYGYILIVMTIRFYFRSVSLLKSKLRKASARIKNLSRKINTDHPRKKEANKFLKRISEYKSKVRKIGEKIKKEENL